MNTKIDAETRDARRFLFAFERMDAIHAEAVAARSAFLSYNKRFGGETEESFAHLTAAARTDDLFRAFVKAADDLRLQLKCRYFDLMAQNDRETRPLNAKENHANES